MPDVSSASKTSSPTDSFLRAAKNGDLSKVKDFLCDVNSGEKKVDVNATNPHGLTALHLAAKHGHEELCQELISTGIAIDVPSKKGNTALHVAALSGHLAIVELLIKAGADINNQSGSGSFTPLYMAAQEGHVAVVRALLMAGADSSISTNDGFSPLVIALHQSHPEVVATLLESSRKSGSTGSKQLPALHVAAKNNDCDSTKLLLNTGTSSVDETSKSGFTALHIASHYGNTKVASLLISKEADVKKEARHGITPCHVASRWGRVEMVRLLLGCGVDINATTRDGLTCLHCAARSGHEAVIEVLIAKGADISFKTKNGLTALHMAAQGDHPESARLLLSYKAGIDDVTIDYLTALHICAHYGNVSTAKLLLEKEADVNYRAMNGFAPLHVACKKNRLKVVQLLVKSGANLEASTESGLTALHVAAFMGFTPIVNYLLRCTEGRGLTSEPLNQEATTFRGETALHLAARANQTEVMRVLIRNGANVNAKAREKQTPLHVAVRLGNADIVMLLLQHGANVSAKAIDDYTPLHIASKEGLADIAATLLEHGSPKEMCSRLTKRGFTPLHLAAKYDNIDTLKVLVNKSECVDILGKNDVTPLHVAAHYQNQGVANYLLENGACAKAVAANGYTPLHIACSKNELEIAPTLIDFGGDSNAKSHTGFTPVHLAAQGGYVELLSYLLENARGDANATSKTGGLTPLHLCAQQDEVSAAAILLKFGADVNARTLAGYTPLHAAAHFGSANMVSFLLEHDADVRLTTNTGYTPLHQAAQQGHSRIVSLLLSHKASPETLDNDGQTPLSIAEAMGYVSVAETLKVVTETIVTTTTITTVEERYRIQTPETMKNEDASIMGDNDEESVDEERDGEHTGRGRESSFITYRYLTSEQMKTLGDDSEDVVDNAMDSKTTRESKLLRKMDESRYDSGEDDSEQHLTQDLININGTFGSGNAHNQQHTPKNVVKASLSEESLRRDTKQFVSVQRGFLVSFMVDARGSSLRGCRHSGLRIVIPPKTALSPVRITCRLVKTAKISIPPPPLMEGENLASRIIELGPVGLKFLGPVLLEIPHYASLRDGEREVTILRYDNGSWREHTNASFTSVSNSGSNAVHRINVDAIANESEEDFLDDWHTIDSLRVSRICTNEWPQYFALVTRIKQETHVVGGEGGIVSSSLVPSVKGVFPDGSLTKRIRVGLQTQLIEPQIVSKIAGSGLAVSPVVTIEPRRRKFHKPITLSIPLPEAVSKGALNKYTGESPSLRLLCSITGGTAPAQWEDITGSTPFTFANESVSFTTTVSARFWLGNCNSHMNYSIIKLATSIYTEAACVAYMAKFVVFCKRYSELEACLRVFVVTDDKVDKTLESEEGFVEVARSRDVEVFSGAWYRIDFAGNIIPTTPSLLSGCHAKLSLNFKPFEENRLSFRIRLKDTNQEGTARLSFYPSSLITDEGKGPGVGNIVHEFPICSLNILLPSKPLILGESLNGANSNELGNEEVASVNNDVTLRYPYLHNLRISEELVEAKTSGLIHTIAYNLQGDWMPLALHLNIPLTRSITTEIKSLFTHNLYFQAKCYLLVWQAVMKKSVNSGTKDNNNNSPPFPNRNGQEDGADESDVEEFMRRNRDLEKALYRIHRDDIVHNCLKMIGGHFDGNNFTNSSQPLADIDSSFISSVTLAATANTTLNNNDYDDEIGSFSASSLPLNRSSSLFEGGNGNDSMHMMTKSDITLISQLSQSPESISSALVSSNLS